MDNARNGPLPDANGSGPQNQILTEPKSILPARKPHGKPIHRSHVWYPLPIPSESAASVRARADPIRRWHKIDGYRRVNSWKELTARQRADYARWWGHTRETWDGGYIRAIETSTIRIGDQFARWTVTRSPEPRPDNPDWYVTCRCTCGTVRAVRLDSLVYGYSLSCGCLAGDRARERSALAQANRRAG
jgi:hypothetical protein